MKALLILPAPLCVAVLCQDVNFPVVVHTLHKLQSRSVLHSLTSHKSQRSASDERARSVVSALADGLVSY